MLNFTIREKFPISEEKHISNVLVNKIKYKRNVQNNEN